MKSRKDMLENYRQLIALREKFQAEYEQEKHGEKDPPKITVASYLKGETYEDSEQKLLVIGRALNGWLEEFNDRDAETTLALWEAQETVGNPMKSRFVWNTETRSYEKISQQQCRGLAWVETYLRYQNDATGKLRHQKTGSTPFWTAARYAAECLGIKDDYTSAIAWTNLFKACPQNGGNPRGALWQEQIEVCNEILKQEIEILTPTHILVVAKTNTSDSLRENEWIAPFEATLKEFSEKGITVVCIHRPEFRAQEDVKEEINALKKKNKKG